MLDCGTQGKNKKRQHHLESPSFSQRRTRVAAFCKGDCCRADLMCPWRSTNQQKRVRFEVSSFVQRSLSSTFRWNVSSSFSSSSSSTSLASSRELKTVHRDVTILDEEEYVVKKSRFLGIAVSCDSWEQATDMLEDMRKERHPKARHICFAWVGRPGTEERSSDDGEPSGTAGIPILGAVKGEGFGNTLCIVVRYFGGIKLGAGGLIRAYGTAARMVLRAVPTEHYTQPDEKDLETNTLSVSMDAAHVGSLHNSILEYPQRHGEDRSTVALRLEEEEYDEFGKWKAILVIRPASQVSNVKVALQQATRGNLQFDTEQQDDDV